MATSVSEPGNAPATATPARDWAAVVHLLHVSRALDQLEEQVLVPQKKVIYQFSARGHDLAQILLGQRLTHRQLAREPEGQFRAVDRVVAAINQSHRDINHWKTQWAPFHRISYACFDSRNPLFRHHTA